MAFLYENETTARTLLHQVLETHPLSSPISSNSRSRSCSKSLFASSDSKLRKQKKTAPVQPKDLGASDQNSVEHYDLLEEGTPRILLKKILQTASEASVLVPVLKNSQEPEPVELQDESKWNSLELQLPKPEPSASSAPELLVRSRRKRCLRVSEFEQKVDQGLAVSSDLTGEQRTSANKSSVTRSFNLTLATVIPPESVKRPGLARRPQTRKKVDMEAFEHGLKDITLTLPPGPRRAIKSWPKSLLQNHPLSANSMSTRRQARPWTGRPSQNSYLSAYSVLATSDISREAVAKSDDVAYQVEEEEEERLMVDQAEESEEDIETPQRAVVSECSMKTPEFLQAKRHRSFSQPASLAPPNTQLPSKLTQAKCVPKRCATGPRQRRDPDKAGLDHYCKVFSYYAKMPMEKSASKTLVKCLDQYFRTLCDDLETFAHHAGRKTVLLDDLELLMRRQGLVTDEVSLHVLVERHLPLEYRRLLIPCAASGNSVFPAE